MTGWEKPPQVPLGDICELQIGRTPSRAEPRYWGPGHPWLSIADMNQGRDLFTTKETITDAAVDECNCRPVRAGTVVMSFKLSVGKVGIIGRSMFTNEAIVALRLRQPSEMDVAYMYHALRALDFSGVGERAAKGITLNRQSLAGLHVPVPPYTEQRRIGVLLDKADGIRRKQRESRRALDEFLQSAYLALVGRRSRDYLRWPELRLAELASSDPGSMRTGPFGSALKHSEFVDSGVAVLGIDNAVQNRFAWVERRFIPNAKYERFKRYTVKPGDVIVTIMGTTGRSAVVPDNIPLAISTKHLAVITVDRSKTGPQFLSHAIHCDPIILAQISAANRGAIMAGLNLGIIKHLRIRVPPLSVQARFDEVVKQVSAVRERLDESEREGNQLIDSVKHRAFQG